MPEPVQQEGSIPLYGRASRWCQGDHPLHTPHPRLTHPHTSSQVLGELSLSSTIQFLPPILTQLLKLLSHSSKDVEKIKPDVLRYVCSHIVLVY